MSKLKSFYVEKFGHDYNRIENSLWYLSELSICGALEIENYISDRNNDFSHVQELAGILEKYKLQDTDTAVTSSHFPYLSLRRAVRKNSDKDIRHYSELALEMGLLKSELRDVPVNSKRLEDLCSLLCDFSREFFDERHQYSYYRRLAAQFYN